MRCPAEREVPVVLARDVEAIGLREAFWIAVSRCHHGDCGLPFANLLPSKFQIVRCETRSVLARRLITEHFGEILRPYLQLRSILYRDSQHFRRDHVGERLSKISDYIHSSPRRNAIDEPPHYIADVASQDLHTLRGKRVGGQTSDPRVGRGIQE